MKWQGVEPTRGTTTGPAATTWSVAGRTVSWSAATPWCGTTSSRLADRRRRERHDQRRGSCATCSTSTSPTRSTHSRARSGSGTWPTSSSPTQTPVAAQPNDFWVSTSAGIFADAFRWAHEADPKALLFYNDYNIAGEDGTNAKFQAVYDFAKTLRRRVFPSTASASRVTSTPSTASTPSATRPICRPSPTWV